MRFSLFSCALLLSMLISPLVAADLYVSPVGSEHADGSIDRPYTLDEARLIKTRDEIELMRYRGISGVLPCDE